MRATAAGSAMMKWRLTKSCRPLRRLDALMTYSWGSAQERFTPGSILPPAPQAKNVNIRFARKMLVMTSLANCPTLRAIVVRRLKPRESLMFSNDLNVAPQRIGEGECPGPKSILNLSLKKNWLRI
jgi:hypothetical protein